PGMPPRGGPPGGRGGRGGSTEPARPGKAIAPADVKPLTTPLYDAGTLRTLFLSFEAADWEQELAAFVNTDVEVPATLMVDGNRYANVGVHFRGASSYFGVPAGYKRSLNLALDFLHDGQAVGGYRTLDPLTGANDPNRPLLSKLLAVPALRERYLGMFVRSLPNGWTGLHSNRSCSVTRL
ncbi:MAG: CotH kinase family protein, partial [Longimicrobiales bacterium]